MTNITPTCEGGWEVVPVREHSSKPKPEPIKIELKTLLSIISGPSTLLTLPKTAKLFYTKRITRWYSEPQTVVDSDPVYKEQTAVEKAKAIMHHTFPLALDRLLGLEGYVCHFEHRDARGKIFKSFNLAGSYNGYEGYFEWGLHPDGKEVVHRYFKPKRGIIAPKIYSDTGYKIDASGVFKMDTWGTIEVIDFKTKAVVALIYKRAADIAAAA